MYRIVCAGCLLFAILAVACSSGNDSSEEPTSPPTATELPQGTPDDDITDVSDDFDRSAPPALTVSTGTESIEAGLGTFCYAGLCADAIGYITPEEALPMIVERLTATLASETIAEVSVTASLASGLESQSICTNDDGTNAGGPLCGRHDALLAWTGAGGEGTALPATADGASVEVDASALEPGTYVVSFFVRFASGGDASYGVLLDVIDAPGARLGP